MTFRRAGAACFLFLALSALMVTGCHRGPKDPGAEHADPAGTADAEQGASGAEVAVSVERAEAGRSEHILRLTGSLGPLAGATARVSPLTPGRVKTVLVRPGQFVRKGQLVAVLDPGPLLGQVQQAEAAVRSATAAIQQAEAGYSATTFSGSAAVQAARTNVAAAEVALQKLLAGTRPEEISQVRSALRAAEANVLSARLNRDRQQRLLAAGLVARKDLEAAQLQLAGAESTLHSVQQDLAVKQHPNRPQDIAAARVNIQQAKDALAAAIAGTMQNRVKAGDVAVARQQLAAAQGALAAARAQLAAENIRAPLSGLVTQRLANDGEYVDTNGGICVISDLSRVRVLLQAPASQVTALQRGQIVRVHPETVPHATYTAFIQTIGSTVNPANNTVQVEATASNSDGRLKDNGFVTASVVTSVANGVVSVSKDALVALEGKPTVFVVGSDSTAHAHTVVPGARTGGRVEILEGIKPGERVVTVGAYELSDGTKVKVAKTGEGRQP